MKLSHRELATVLAALRCWQIEVDMDYESKHAPILWDVASDGDTITALSIYEIDDLCERLNFDTE